MARTFNIQRANQQISDSIGIDILEFKLKVDKQFPADSFYNELCHNILVKGNSAIYDKFGFMHTYDNGDSILKKDVDKLTRHVLHGLADNIIYSECGIKKTKTDFCKKKKDLAWNFYATKAIWTTTPSEYRSLKANFRKGYYSYEEYSFMCVVHHFLHSLSRIKQDLPISR